MVDTSKWMYKAEEAMFRISINFDYILTAKYM